MGRHILQQVAGSSCFEDSEYILIIVIGAQHKNSPFGVNGFDLLGRFDPVQLRHGDIHYDHIRMQISG